MKILILIIWLLICLLPFAVKAEEPVKAPVGEGPVLVSSSPQKERPWVIYRLSLPELGEGRGERLSDEEMADMRGRSLSVPPAIQSSSGESAIILWDEAHIDTPNTDMDVRRNKSVLKSIRSFKNA